MRKIAVAILKRTNMYGLARRLYRTSASTSTAPSMPETSVAEATPLAARLSGFEAQRLNLLVPSLAIQHVFGGVSTALDVFFEIGKRFPNLRIILTEQHVFAPADNPKFADWKILRLDEEDSGGKTIVAAGDRWGKALAIGANDRFVATAWWTAVSARSLQGAQASFFGAKFPFVYLIQDYEPGFYPWSARYALAAATYDNPSVYVPVFNTRILRDFFVAQGQAASDAAFFEPSLHQGLRQHAAGDKVKRRRVLVYGRPSVERNCFPIIAMGLRALVARGVPSGWEFVSAGELHPPIELGAGHFLRSVGKLSINDYARELASASIGISLMMSPHPSYPPLEMAAFGVQVITNSYGSKDLSTFHPGIRSLSTLSPEYLADAVAQAMDAHQELVGDTVFAADMFVDFQRFKRGANSMADVADAICKQLFAARAMESGAV